MRLRLTFVFLVLLAVLSVGVFAQTRVKTYRVNSVVFDFRENVVRVNYEAWYEGTEDFRKYENIVYESSALSTILNEARTKIKEKEGIQ